MDLYKCAYDNEVNMNLKNISLVHSICVVFTHSAVALRNSSDPAPHVNGVIIIMITKIQQKHVREC